MAVNKRLPMNGRLYGGTFNRCQPYLTVWDQMTVFVDDGISDLGRSTYRPWKVFAKIVNK